MCTKKKTPRTGLGALDYIADEADFIIAPTPVSAKLKTQQNKVQESLMFGAWTVADRLVSMEVHHG